MSLVIDRLQARRGSFSAGPLTVGMEPGECLVLMGANGAGKTTLLEALAGFVDQVSGHILLDGADLSHRPPERRHFAYLPQDLALFPHLVVTENVSYAAKQYGGRQWLSDVASLIDEFDLGDLRDHYPHQLSRGQAQRVAFARALAARPRVLLLDEPTASLDVAGRQSFHVYMRKLLTHHRLIIIHATHNVLGDLSSATSISVIDHGHIVQTGTPTALFQRPTDARVAELLGITNQWRTRITARTDTEVHILFGTQEFLSTQPSPNNGELVAAIGPGEIELRTDQPSNRRNWTTGTVEASQVSGQAALIELRCEFGTLRAAIPPQQVHLFPLGQTCWAHLPASCLRLVAAPP